MIVIEENKLTFNGIRLDEVQIFNHFYKQGSGHSFTGLELCIISTIKNNIPVGILSMSSEMKYIVFKFPNFLLLF